MISVNGIPTLSGTLAAPYVGTWVADVQLPSDEPISGRVQLDTWIGTVVDGAQFAGRGYYRIVGGNGGLRGEVKARHHRSATVGRILGSICSDTGESKSLLVDPRFSLKTVSYWTRSQGTGGAAVSALADSLGAVWRMLPTGELWIGNGPSPIPAPGQFPVLDADPTDRVHVCAPESLSLWAGMSQDAGTIKRIVYSWGEHLRATYWT